MSAEPPTIDQAQLTGIICERPQNFAWFLGAGASRSAGLPTATDIIWDLKRRYYCQQENEDISRQDVHLEAVRSRIQSYIASKGFPTEWAREEYSICFEKIFGDDKERQRRYLAGILAEDKATLSVGNRALGDALFRSQPHRLHHELRQHRGESRRRGERQFPFRLSHRGIALGHPGPQQ
jgi:hypothetical protein